jgi:hypothetical protein
VGLVATITAIHIKERPPRLGLTFLSRSAPTGTSRRDLTVGGRLYKYKVFLYACKARNADEKVGCLKETIFVRLQ